MNSMKVETDLDRLVRRMEPVLRDGVYAYVIVDREAPPDVSGVVFLFHEREGTTLVLPEQEALRAGLTVLLRVAWITLDVNSALEAVGFTAAFSRALSDRGISCNVVAGAVHDHIFVPHGQAQDAMAALRRLQSDASEESTPPDGSQRG